METRRVLLMKLCRNVANYQCQKQNESYYGAAVLSRDYGANYDRECRIIRVYPPRQNRACPDYRVLARRYGLSLLPLFLSVSSALPALINLMSPDDADSSKTDCSVEYLGRCVNLIIQIISVDLIVTIISY